MNGHGLTSFWADLRKMRYWTPLLRDSLTAKSFNLIRCCWASKCTVGTPIHLVVTVSVYCLNVKLQRSMQATRPLHNVSGVLSSFHILLQYLFPEELLKQPQHPSLTDHRSSNKANSNHIHSTTIFRLVLNIHTP